MLHKSLNNLKIIRKHRCHTYIKYAILKYSIKCVVKKLTYKPKVAGQK